VIFVPLTVVRVGVAVVLKEPYLGWRSNYQYNVRPHAAKVAMDAQTEIGGTPLGHPPYSPDLAPMRFLGFSKHEKRAPMLETACSTILLKLAANGLQHVLEKWVERCKKCIAGQGKYFEKETVTAPPQNFDLE
jgi:hypothetical protein